MILRPLLNLLSPPSERPWWVRACVVILSVDTSIAIRIYLDPWLGDKAPFGMLMPAVLVSAWFGGARAGFIAAMLGAVLAWWFFMEPSDSVRFESPGDFIVFGIYLLQAVLISVLCGLLHRALMEWRAARRQATVDFENMADHAPGFVWSTAADGSPRFINRCWRAFTGMEERGGNVDRFERIHPADGERVRSAMARAKETSAPCHVEYRLLRADGVYRWILEHAVPRYSSDGVFEGFVGAGTDVTPSHQERDELRFIGELHGLLAPLLDLEKTAAAVTGAVVPAVADWCCIHLFDEGDGELKALRVHHASAGRVGRAEEVLSSGNESGAIRAPVFLDILRDGEPRLVSAVDDAFIRTLAEGAAQETFFRELALMSFIGVPLRVRGRSIGVLSLATAESGRVLGHDTLQLALKIAGIAALALENARLHRNMRVALEKAEQAWLARNTAEAELERQRALLKTIIDAVPAMVAYIDPDERFLVHNRQYERWLGVGYHDIHGKTIRELMGEERYPESQPHLQAALEGNNVRFEKEIQSKGDGIHAKPRDAMVSYRPDIGPDGRVAGVVIHAFDITESRRMAIEVARSEKRYRTLISASAAIVWAADATGKVRETDGWEDFTGRAPGHDVAAEWCEFIHPEDRERVERAWLLSAATSRIWECDYRLLACDGRYHHVRARAAAIAGLDGAIEEWIGTVSDMTMQVEAERSLRDKEAELKLIIDTMPALVAYVDRDLCYGLTNQAYTKWFGPKAGSMRGMKVSDLVGEEAFAVVRGRLDEALAGRVVHFEDYIPYIEGRPRWISATLTPHHDADGVVIGFFALAIDITERKRAEHELADALARYRFLADAMPQNVWTANAAGEQDYVNRRWVEYTGIAEEEGSRNRWGEIVHPDDREATGLRWMDAVRKGEAYRMEHRLRDATGEYHWFLSLALARRDEEGRVVQWVGTATNIDEQRHAYSQLVEARADLRRRADNLENEVRLRTARLEEVNAELEAFTSSASHDLRVPLHHIQGFTDAILDDGSNTLSPDGHANIRMILLATRRMDRLIVDLLAYSRLSHAEIAVKPMDVERTLDEVLSELKITVEAAKAEIVVERPLPRAAADDIGLRQVLTNLLGNALKFVPPGRRPCVRIRAEHRGARVRLWIEDDGIGIDPSQHDAIFKIFHRLHGNRDYEGTGIGLSLVKRAMLRMGGDCGVESAKGSGSRFWVEFRAETSPGV